MQRQTQSCWRRCQSLQMRRLIKCFVRNWMSLSNTNAMWKGASDSNRNSNNLSNRLNKPKPFNSRGNNSRKKEPDLLND